jgi:hypothetical protein
MRMGIKVRQSVGMKERKISPARSTETRHTEITPRTICWAFASGKPREDSSELKPGTYKSSSRLTH